MAVGFSMHSREIPGAGSCTLTPHELAPALLLESPDFVAAEPAVASDSAFGETDIRAAYYGSIEAGWAVAAAVVIANITSEYGRGDGEAKRKGDQLGHRLHERGSFRAAPIPTQLGHGSVAAALSFLELMPA
jgi:hypothetical protein